MRERSRLARASQPASRSWPSLLLARSRLEPRPTVVYRVDRVTDGDTAVLRNGQRVRLVQIDAVAVVFGAALAA